MARAFDFTVVTVTVLISIIIHMMGLELFAPGTPLHQLASGASTLNGAERANLWYQVLTIWVPLIADGGILGWAVLREYRRQATTAARPVR